jgi:hypothetical protein
VFRIDSLDGEEHEIRIPSRVEFGRRLDRNDALEVRAFEKETVPLPDIHMSGTSDQSHGRPRSSEHRAEVPTDRSGADHGDSWRVHDSIG